MPTLAEAWEYFKKAEKFERMAMDPSKAEAAKRMALRGADKNLDLAIKAEAEALDAGERHGGQ